MNEPARLSADQREALSPESFNGVGLSVISCWEVAMLISKGRLDFSLPLGEWFAGAIEEAGVLLQPLTPAVSIEANSLPGEIHRDPSDRIIVATARTLGCPLLTADAKLLDYPHVETVG